DKVDTLTFTLVTSSNGTAEFSDDIYPGDTKLYSIFPVVRYGGAWLSNDTIKTGLVELSDKMIISNGVTLTINSEYAANDTITLTGSGFISGAGYFYLGEEGEIKINSWSKSSFKRREGSHPKLIWGEYPAATVVGYKIYRMKETQNFVYLATVTGREFTDTTTTIVTGGEHPNETIAQYKVSAVLILPRKTKQ